MPVYLICSGLLVLMYFALSVNVSRLRGHTKTNVGMGPDPSGPLAKAVRAHANAAEYVPLLVALFLFFAFSSPPGWVAWVALIVTAARVLHAAGMLMTVTFDGPPHPLRAVGAMLTYLGGLALGVALLTQAFM
jgi:uncharacterized membrane protein YecN with MAPEG domain